MAGRRILYQLVAPLDATVGPEEPRRREAFLMAHALPGSEVAVRSAARGRNGIEGAWDAVEAAPAVVAGIRQAEREGLDAAIIGCFSDPALDAAREAVDIPVIGAGSAAILLALQLADRVSVLSPGDGGGARTRAFFRAMGLEARLVSARGVGMSVGEMAAAARDGRLDDAIDRVAAHATACVEEDGAEAILLGCMSMAFLDPTPRIEARVRVPVVNPVLAALRAAEGLASLGLRHSRRRWPKAENRPIVEAALDQADTAQQKEASR